MFRALQYAMLIVLVGLSVPISVSAQEDSMTSCENNDPLGAAPSIGVRAMMVLNSLQTGDTSAALNFINPDTYIQHNLSAPDGRDGFLGLLSVTSSNDNPNSYVNTQRILVNGNMVVAHTEYFFEVLGGGLTAFDVFRFDDDGLIVEHWDNLQPVAEPNPSGRTAIDGDVTITDLDKTQENCELVINFVNTFWVEGNRDIDLTQYINAETYIQHNTNIGDGLDTMIAAVSGLPENNLVAQYNSIELVVA